MRKYLNNPRFVIPLAVFAMLWLAYRYNLLDEWIPHNALPVSNTFKPSVAAVSKPGQSETRRQMSSLIRNQWLPRNWEKYSAIRKEPFLANYSFEKADLEYSSPVAAVEVPVPVVIAPDALDDYIAENIGLDKLGFFVRFDSIYKREGDIIYTTDGRELVLGKIAIADEARTGVAHQDRVLEVLAEMKLYGVVSDSSEVADSDLSDTTQIKKSAVITGGIQDGGIYQLGDLLCRNPVLGLAAVHNDQVEVVDRYGNAHVLKLE